LHLSRDSEKECAKVFHSLEKKTVPYFWRKRIPGFFLQKYLFLPKPEFGFMS
jgi:hypothetical protein